MGQGSGRSYVSMQSVDAKTGNGGEGAACGERNVEGRAGQAARRPGTAVPAWLWPVGCELGAPERPQSPVFQARAQKAARRGAPGSPLGTRGPSQVLAGAGGGDTWRGCGAQSGQAARDGLWPATPDRAHR